MTILRHRKMNTFTDLEMLNVRVWLLCGHEYRTGEYICCQEKHNATRCTDSGRLGCMASWEKSTDYPYLLVLETKSGKHFLRLLENTKDLNMLNTTECDIYVA
ncbi:uncharacterized protein LOC124459058 isoform X1 [Xenia sp. Carnegie-2017]|uniref:uncharacterized protein LOC124459058 isoform X1 n=1 Tax=Xenia sp. Carnegie-2017 TaxID=2897299 RepID=UPI001F042B77|nr:uncharacterized protein LOC124459058 isoform X1 [Xenia sp. Carnegie-2017]